MLPVSPLLISRRRARPGRTMMPATLLCMALLHFTTRQVESFVSPSYNHHLPPTAVTQRTKRERRGLTASSRPPSTTSLNVWWFGGTEQNELNENDESCELVAVRIERTSANSRRISGDIVVSAPLEDVWAILTDYNRLAKHIPNLVESKVVSAPRMGGGTNGDGSYKCRLFQKGAQKIIGFEFGASVTMDMTERIVTAANYPTAAESSYSTFQGQDRRIGFKCVDSQFFSEFDGEWKAKEQIGPDGQIETAVYYVVDVRPKGPVPVAALEWRIREDVPTNLRAVKAASLTVGRAGVLALNERSTPRRRLATSSPAAATADAPRPVTVKNGVRVNGKSAQIRRRNGSSQQKSRSTRPSPQSPTPQLVPVPVMADWDADETMAKYL